MISNDGELKKQLNHRERSRQRYTGLGVLKHEPILAVETPKSSKHIVYEDEIIQSPLKIRGVPTEKT